ncbi:hypothetical protein H2509_13400 [Stappia sp. F7233]|uniref:Uncharacterized protein n=1 Tax=Stappia albiluteola TaxID=2758565 RepID=A0A839AEI7_9HYPH|nr:hypothetical protein [Stappia albiluteola]MBA5777448.1 hypothetical protein [Stappia albiluteola]MBA5777486.1 hypothetical protein [Stappia albiluteola]MBA5778103.1 hypothetical protein [Stappia albiluteola]MBA5778120.1 hypothetical protein [Stappia albiluteola]
MAFLYSAVSGSEVGNKLARDPELFAEVLNEVQDFHGDDPTDRFIQDLAEASNEKLSEFLRMLADRIEFEKGSTP